MKCKCCNGRLKKMWSDINYNLNGVSYRVINAPVQICEVCKEQYIEPLVAKRIEKYAKLVEGDTIHYMGITAGDAARRLF